MINLILDGNTAAAIELAAASHPVITTILAFMGLFRLIFKPLLSLAQAIVDHTETASDNEWLAKLQAHPIFKGIEYVLNWSLSIKLPVKKAPADVVTPPSEKPPAA